MYIPYLTNIETQHYFMKIPIKYSWRKTNKTINFLIAKDDFVPVIL